MQTAIVKGKMSTRQEKAKVYQTMIDQTIEKLINQLESGFSDDMMKYLKAMSFFHRYSLNNLFLILGQKPEATHVAGFRTWMKLNRKVKKGEKGIRIMAPVISKKEKVEEDEKSDEDDDPILYFRTVCVFDESQTSGQELPKPSQSLGDASKLIPVIENAIRNDGIVIEYGETGEALGISCKGKIIIKHGLSSAEKFSTLIHEYAHELLHQSGKSKQSKTIQELEADAIACIVSEHCGIKAIQASADYIKLWNGDKEILLQRLDHIRQCASGIIQTIERNQT